MKKIYTIYSDKIKRDISITLLSDFHYVPGMNMNFLFKQLEELSKNPTDYIFILGDIINDSMYNIEELRELQDYLYQLSKIGCKIYSVLGNHDQLTKKNSDCWADYYNEDYVNMLRNFDNFVLLENEIIQVSNFTIGGTRFSGEYYEAKEPVGQYVAQMKENICFDGTETINILLDHSPARAFDKKVLESIKGLKNADLIFSGHMHNGCIPVYIDKFLPGNFGIISPNMDLKPKYSRGKKQITKDTTGIIASPITTFTVYQGLFQKLNKLYPPIEQKVLIRKR